MNNSSVQITKYNILRGGKVLYTSLTEEEYFDIMEDLAIEFYQTGSPNPQEIVTEVIGELSHGKIKGK